ncbi:unnamed protein product [Urochloa humidicola]
MANDEGNHARGGGGEAIPRRRGLGGCKRKITPEERAAATRFIMAALEALKQYNTMEEEEIEEEYRRAGNLHKYDPDTEWQKRVARVARAYPPPDFIAAGNVDGFVKILEEDEQDCAIGLAGCAGIFEEL